MRKPKQILIADDHDVVRMGIKSILKDHFQPLHIGEAENFAEVRNKVDTQKWDIIILDISMAEGNILETINYIKTKHTDTHVLILSMYPEDQYAVHMLKSGASGYINKENVSDELAVAVQTMLNGEKYISQSLASKIAFSFTQPEEKPKHESLSPREFQIFLMISQGKSLKLIAEELCISDRTVSTHKSRIQEKMDFQTNADFVQYAINHRLLDV